MKTVQFVPDLIVVDIQVRDIPITELVDTLRRLPKFAQKPILGYSFYDATDLDNPEVRKKVEDIQRAKTMFLSAGGTEYIGRFKIQTLVKRMVAQFQGQKKKAAQAEPEKD
jgi:hypothetical protein